MFLIFWDELAGEFWQGNGGTDLCTPFPCPNSSANVGLRFFVLMGLGLPSELSFLSRSMASWEPVGVVPRQKHFG